MNLFLIFFIIFKIEAYNCPHYDNVLEIEDGSDDDSLYQNSIIYSCSHNFLKNLETTSCQLLIFDCSFANINRISTSGGAMYLKFVDSRPTRPESIIDNCKFTNCTARYGGAISIDGHKNSSEFRVTNCLFENNRGDLNGGAFYVETVFLTCINCRFINNTANSNGMVIHYIKTDLPMILPTLYLTIQDCYFENDITTKVSPSSTSLIYLATRNNYLVALTVTNTEIYMSNVPSGLTFIKFQHDSSRPDKFSFAGNYIVPYDKNVFISSLRNYKFDFESSSEPFQPPIEPEHVISQKKEDDELLPSESHVTGSTENRVKVLVEQSTFSNYQTSENKGLLTFENIEVECTNNKFSNCQTTNGVGGAMTIKNENEVNYKIRIQNVRFSNCKSTCGGALYIHSTSERSNILIRNCVFKSNSVTKKDGDLFGGSAIYLCSPKANIKDCEFLSNKGGSIVKVVNPNDVEKMKVLSSDENAIYIDGCNFLTNQKSKEAVYFVAGESRRSLNIVNCSFKGKLAKGVNFIDGKLAKNNEPRIRLHNCNFQSKAINNNVILSSSSCSFDGNYLNIIFMCMVAVAFITFITFLIIKFKKSHKEIIDEDESGDKTVINESL